ncbi:chaperone protein DnaJ [Peptococcaceae bacterium CEB3]|nr:chaperone protein DnaJ [Peptococcaceae bacterium CEB3]
METRKTKRRRSSKAKVENYYKILGVRANANPKMIKQKYIELVKANPPETHPDEFQQIRRAYEVLRDPHKRREYDMMRKYGGQVEKIMLDTQRHIEAGDYEKAEELVRQAIEMMPDNPSIRFTLAEIALLQENLELFREQFDLVEQQAEPESKPTVLAFKAHMLLETDYTEEAVAVLDLARVSYPREMSLYLGIYSEAYQELDREEDLWQLILDSLPAPGTETPEDIHIFIQWLNAMIDLEKWSVKSTIQQRLRKFLRSVRDVEDKVAISLALLQEHDGYLEVGRFQEAEIFIDFAYYINPSDPELQAQRKETQQLMRLEKDIRRLERDQDAFPLLALYVREWLYADYWDDEDLEDLRGDLPPFLDGPAGQNLEIDQILAEGVLYLRKKYPLLYLRFQDEWDELFQERMQGLNREARRSMKFR